MTSKPNNPPTHTDLISAIKQAADALDEAALKINEWAIEPRGFAINYETLDDDIGRSKAKAAELRKLVE